MIAVLIMSKVLGFTAYFMTLSTTQNILLNILKLLLLIMSEAVSAGFNGVCIHVIVLIDLSWTGEHYFMWYNIDKVCQRFSLGTLVSSTNKIDSNNMTEILLKVVLNTITFTPLFYVINSMKIFFLISYFVNQSFFNNIFKREYRI